MSAASATGQEAHGASSCSDIACFPGAARSVWLNGVCWTQDHSPFEPLLFCLQGIVTNLFVTYGLGQGSSGIWAPLPVLGLDKTQAAACQAMCQ